MAAQKPAVTMLPTGERIIAATRRKDGTMRKEVKVRAGWVTEELDERARVYRKQIQRAEDLRNYIPGLGSLEEQKAKREAAKAAAATNSRAARRKRARERKAAGKANQEAKGDAWSDDSEDEATSKPSSAPSSAQPAAAAAAPAAAPKAEGKGKAEAAKGVPKAEAKEATAKAEAKAEAPNAAEPKPLTEEERQRQVRKWQKLLKEIEELEVKAKSKQLNPDQQAKLKRKESVLQELAKLQISDNQPQSQQ